MIPRERTEIRWRTTDEPPSRVVETKIHDRDDLRAGSDIDNYDLDSSLGACCAGWMDPAYPWETPEGVFIEMTRQGYFNDDALLEALEEFSKVEGCGWAALMARGLKAKLDNERVK